MTVVSTTIKNGLGGDVIVPLPLVPAEAWTNGAPRDVTGQNKLRIQVDGSGTVSFKAGINGATPYDWPAYDDNGGKFDTIDTPGLYFLNGRADITPTITGDVTLTALAFI